MWIGIEKEKSVKKKESKERIDYSSEINKLTNQWKRILKLKKYGENRLQFLLAFNEEQISFLRELVILHSTIDRIKGNASAFYFRFLIGYRASVFHLTGMSLVTINATTDNDLPIHFNETQLNIVAEWLIEMLERKEG